MPPKLFPLITFIGSVTFLKTAYGPSSEKAGNRRITCFYIENDNANVQSLSFEFIYVLHMNLKVFAGAAGGGGWSS